MLKTRIIRIGNSRGIRIPESLLEQTGLEEEVELQVSKDRIVIGPVRNPRKNWDDAFRKMANIGDNELLDKDIQSQWDKTEWQW